MDDQEEDDDDLIYVMRDVDAFVDEVRKIVFAGFGSNVEEGELAKLVKEIDQEELDQSISLKECRLIALENITVKKTSSGKIKYFFTNKQFSEIIEAINTRLVSNLLNKLVDEGELQSGYCDESNDFIFWIPDNDDNNK